MPRDNQVKTIGTVIVALAVVFAGYNLMQTGKLPGFSATPSAVCGNLICEIGESSMTCPTDCKSGQQPVQPVQPSATCGDGVCGTTETATSCASDCSVKAGLTCPSDATTSFEVNVRDVLNETGYNRLAVTVKKIDENGQLIDESTSSATASTIMKVPCKKATYTLIAYNDDNSGVDIYPVEVKANGYTIENGALAGGRIPVTLNAKQQGTIATAVWDSSATQTDHNITFAMGETNPYTRMMIRESEDDKSAEAVMCMMNYTTSKIKTIEWNGYSPSGLTAQETQVPTVYAGDGGYEKAWNIMLNGKPLTLDGDSRTSDPDRVYFDITLYAYSNVDPGQQNVTFRCIDRVKYWEADGVTWANGGVPRAENAEGTNLGIAQASEGIDEALMFYE